MQITLPCSYESSFTSNDLRPIDIHDVNAERIHLQSVFICRRIDGNSKNCLPPPNGDHAATRVSRRLGPIHLVRVLRRRENRVHVYLNCFLVGALKRLIGSVEFCNQRLCRRATTHHRVDSINRLSLSEAVACHTSKVLYPPREGACLHPLDRKSTRLNSSHGYIS